MTKIERNILCPCGSGKKYKKCCAAKKNTLFSSKIMIGIVLFVLFAITGVFLLRSSKNPSTNSPPADLTPLTTSYTDIPGVDLSRLTEAQKAEVLQKANRQNCPCGCSLTITVCRQQHATCSTSLSIAQAMVKELEDTSPSNKNASTNSPPAGFDTQAKDLTPLTTSYTEIPGVDLSKLTEAQKEKVLQRANRRNCTCGCGLTITVCRQQHATCSTSLSVAQAMAKELENTSPSKTP